MAAPERFAKRQIPLAPRAPSIHGPSLLLLRCKRMSVVGGRAEVIQSVATIIRDLLDTEISAEREARAKGRRYGLTATMPSISTEIWLGSMTLPTAERA